MGIPQETLASVNHKESCEYICSVLYELVHDISQLHGTVESHEYVLPDLKYIRMNKLRITRKTPNLPLWHNKYANMLRMVRPGTRIAYFFHEFKDFIDVYFVRIT